VETNTKVEKATDPIDQAEELTRSVMARLDLPVSEADGRDISDSKYRMMSAIERFGPVSIGRIATLVGSAQSSTSEMVSRLMRAGLVEKVRGTYDGRVVTVTLTPEGRGLVRRRRKRIREVYGLMLGRLGEKDRESFLEALKNLDASFRKTGG